MKRLFLLALLLNLFFATYAQTTKNAIKKVSVAKLERKLRKEVQLIDVRTAEEFNLQHIEKAININIDDSTFNKKLQLLDKSKPVYLYCRSGKRSNKAAHKMAALGFNKIYDLKGGILAWDKKKSKE